MNTIEDIPILSGQTFSGHAGELRKTRGMLFLRLMRELGDIGMIRIFSVPIVVPCSPKLVHEILVEKQKSFEKSIATRVMFYPFAGRGLFTNEGEPWRKQRKLVAPLFHPGAIKDYAPAMNAVITRYLDGWKDGSVIDIGREMVGITMAVASKILFDANTIGESDEISIAVRAMFEYISEQSGSLSLVARTTLIDMLRNVEGPSEASETMRAKAIEALHQPARLPNPKRIRLFAAVRTLDSKIQQMIAERRKKGSTRDDALSRLLSARDEDDGSFMNDRQVRDETITLFVAGHETTATSMTWTLYFLSRNPDIYRAWKDENERLAGQIPNETTAAEAARLEYTRGIFRETLRIYPPAFAVDRSALEDVNIGGYWLPRGTTLIIPVHAIHRREDAFPDPERFDPTRFLPDAEAKRPRGAYIPFGIGPRVCIGATFAELEAQLLLAQIAWRFDFEPAETAPIGPDFHTALRPKRPVLLRIHARERL